MANDVCALYESDDLVCPPSLKQSIFTTSAVDNLDHNPSSSTPKTSFHGTAITLTNHLSKACSETSCDFISRPTTTIPHPKKMSDLPTAYTLVPPASL